MNTFQVSQMSGKPVGTYEQFLEVSREHPTFKGKDQYFGVHKSSLKKWLAAKGKTFASDIGAEFTHNFNDNVEGGLKDAGFVAGTDSYKNAKCRLKKLHTIFDEVQMSATRDSRPFHEVLREALETIPTSKGKRVMVVCRVVGVSYKSVVDWIAGKLHPSKKWVPGFAKLEAELGLTPKTLTSRIFQGPSLKEPKIVRTETSQHHLDLIRTPYRLHLSDWPPNLVSEWTGYYVPEKTQSALAIHNPTQETSGWSDDRPKKGTYKRELTILEAFFGYLTN